jgi:hypothetical protein
MLHFYCLEMMKIEQGRRACVREAGSMVTFVVSARRPEGGK